MVSRSLLHDLGQSLKHPEFWAYSSWLDIAIKYRRTSIGLLWLFLAFAFFVLVMGFKYAYLMGEDPELFVPYLAVGYMTWRFMIQVLTDSVSTFATHRSYIMDGRVRLTDYLLRSVAKSTFYWLFALVIVAGVLAWSTKVDLAGLATLLVTFPLLAFNMMWIGACVALLGARYQDTHEFIGTALMAAFLFTPIIWNVDLFPPDTTRGFITRLNPAFHLIEIVRSPVLGRLPEFTSVVAVGAMAVFGWILAAVMYRRYARFVPLWV